MDKKKKPFKETGVGRFLIEKAPSLLGLVGDAILPGNVISGLINGSSEISDLDKEIAREKLRIERAEIDGVTKRWVADAKSDSWIAQNVRPLTLIFLTVAFVIGWYLQIEELSTVQSLLQIVFIGYFGSRGMEKIVPNSKWSK